MITLRSRYSSTYTLETRRNDWKCRSNSVIAYSRKYSWFKFLQHNFCLFHFAYRAYLFIACACSTRLISSLVNFFRRRSISQNFRPHPSDRWEIFHFSPGGNRRFIIRAEKFPHRHMRARKEYVRMSLRWILSKTLAFQDIFVLIYSLTSAARTNKPPILYRRDRDGYSRKTVPESLA